MTRLSTANSWTWRSDAEVEEEVVPAALEDQVEGVVAVPVPVPAARAREARAEVEVAAVARVAVAVAPPVRPAIREAQQAEDLARRPLTAVEGMIQVQVQVQPTTSSIPTTPTVTSSRPPGLGSPRRRHRGLPEPSTHRKVQRQRLRRMTDTMPVARVHPTPLARGLL